jgi:tetratricopeptide (TPR) repeat protein
MRIHLLALLLVALFGSILYSHTLEYPFVFDDRPNITQNARIRIRHLNFNSLLRAATESPTPNRPISNLSFGLNYYFSDYHPRAYRLVNLIIHILNGFMVYLIINLTLNLNAARSEAGVKTGVRKFYDPIDPEPVRTAFIVSLIWVIHPIQTQSVTYVVQRMNSMAVLFYLLALCCYITGRLSKSNHLRWSFWFLSLLSWILALGSKEIAATLPLVVFLYEWYFFQELSVTWLRKNLKLLAVPFLLFFLAALLYLGRSPVEKILGAYSTREFTLVERLLTQPKIFIFYIIQLLFPHPSRLNLDHHFVTSISLGQVVATFFSVMIIAFLIWQSYRLARRGERLLSFFILWIFIHLAIESSIIGLEMAFEHRLYLPSIGFILVVTLLCKRLLKGRPKFLSLIVPCIVITLFSIWTYQRNKVWKDEVTLWADCVKKSPNKPRPYVNLGNALYRGGQFEEAIGYYSKALNIKSDFAVAYYNLGVVMEKQGNFQKAADHYHEAIALDTHYADAHLHFLEVLRIKPDSARAHYNLGNLLEELGKLEKAMYHYSEALRIEPDYVKARTRLENLRAGKRKMPTEQALTSIASRSRLKDADDHVRLANAFVQQGKLEEARSHYLEALRIQPSLADVHVNLGNVWLLEGKVDKAIEHYSKALEIQPGQIEAHLNLANTLAKQGKLDEVRVHYSEVLRIQPDHAEAHFYLGNILTLQGRVEEAKGHYAEALRIKPDFEKARIYLKRLERR